MKLAHTQKLGQIRSTKLGGTQGFLGQSYGQNRNPTRRGVERCKVDELGPTGLAGKPPPSGGGGGVSAETEQTSALQVTLWLCGAHNKHSKNVMMQGNQRLAGREQVSTSFMP